jgi:hypothetical protein
MRYFVLELDARLRYVDGVREPAAQCRACGQKRYGNLSNLTARFSGRVASC